VNSGWRTLSILVVVLVGSAHGLFAQSSWENAVSLFQQKNWLQAESAFAEVERWKPGQTDALLYRGKSLVNLGRFGEAAASLQSYRGTHAHSDDAAYLLGFVMFRQNRPKDSLEIYTQAAKLKPPSADDLKIVALDYVLLGDVSDAARYLEMAVHMDPNNVEARYHLGRVHYQQNRFDQATADFQRVLQLDPRNAKAQDNLGLTLEAKNDAPSAMAAYRKAVELDGAAQTHSEHPYINLANSLLQAGKTEEALPLLKTAVQLNPKFSRTHYLLSKAYLTLGQSAEAQQEVETSIRLDSNNSSAHYLLGRIYRNLGKTELANREFALTEAMIKAQHGDSPGARTMEGEPPKDMPE
jgi:tetratricopeptide (TPR) repeat protein